MRVIHEDTINLVERNTSSQPDSASSIQCFSLFENSKYQLSDLSLQAKIRTTSRAGWNPPPPDWRRCARTPGSSAYWIHEDNAQHSRRDVLVMTSRWGIPLANPVETRRKIGGSKSHICVDWLCPEGYCCHGTQRLWYSLS